MPNAKLPVSCTDWMNMLHKLLELSSVPKLPGLCVVAGTLLASNGAIAKAFDCAKNLAAPTINYSQAQNKRGQVLKSWLHSRIQHKRDGYACKNGRNFGYKDVWEALYYTDEDPDNKDNVILLYTGRSELKTFRSSNHSQSWTREHVWPKSHGFRSPSSLPYFDLHHLRPVDRTVNSSRGHKDFDNGGHPHSEATEGKADADSWEPRERVKGDIARMIFYMAVRYNGSNSLPNLEILDEDTASDTPKIGRLCTLVSWNEEDKVSADERRRHERIAKIQRNRNPFVDQPKFVKQIWGNQCD